VDTATGEVSTDELRRDIASQREDIGRDLEAIGDRLSPGRMADRSKERTRRRVMTWREKIMGVAGDARSRMGDTAQMMGSAAPSSDASASDMVHEASDRVTERVEGSPLVAGMVAFGIGFIAGSVLPASRQEQEVARSIEPQVQHLAQEAADTARSTGEHLAPVVKEEANAVKEDASEAASQVAGAAKSEMASARDDVKKDVKS
jgi:hypothetical protein